MEWTEENSDLDQVNFTRTQYLLDCQDLWRTRHEEHSEVLLQLKISSAPPCLSSIHYLHQGNSLSVDEQNNLYFSFTIFIFLNYFCQQICPSSPNHVKMQTELINLQSSKVSHYYALTNSLTFQNNVWIVFFLSEAPFKSQNM